ncbi:MAG: phosphoribosyl-AMP cyclohydrolase [Candidatus Omnitrophota bacterium]
MKKPETRNQRTEVRRRKTEVRGQKSEDRRQRTEDRRQRGKIIVPKLKFDEKGLIPAIVQDVKNGDVLMIAYMNEESLRITLKEKRTCFYSRSRQTLWRKGDTSGHIQKVKAVCYDCDCDALLIKVEQTGVACHTGESSCFYRKII